jgi:hypothetical protein
MQFAKLHHYRICPFIAIFSGVSVQVMAMLTGVDLRQIFGRLRFVQLGSILAPIKRAKPSRFSELCLAESTDSFG